MPIYEYLCSGCNEKFELLVRNSGSQPKQCPNCGDENITKLFSTFGFSSGGSFVSSVGGSGCDSCTTYNCSSCH
ncbi:MAG: zinc ribbon domain-containing protein [Candidatus Zixiibacteriota bacterium]